ncbi:MAG: hypothetical protein HY706_16785 [Candidatus Hydrogenedentes bacterium]|nr:hypothetical protein [Candidatus Hydrogenedentota bacterium]
MGYAMRLLFGTIAVCVSFVVVLVTVALICCAVFFLVEGHMPRAQDAGQAWLTVGSMVFLGFLFFLYLFGRMARGLLGHRNLPLPAPRERDTDMEESRTMQEIYHGLSKMEKRIEALETILLEDRSRRTTPL